MRKKIDWIEPLKVAEFFKDKSNKWILLYSSLKQDEFSGDKSIFAIYPKNEIAAVDFNEFEQTLRTSQDMWFGYLGYGLKNSLENLPQDEDSIIEMPDLWFVNYHLVFIFYQDSKQIEIIASDETYLSDFDFSEINEDENNNSLTSLKSNMTKDEYLEKVNIIKQAILRGDLYQANLTRKFYGEFESTIDSFNIFQKLCEISPAPYSALLKFDDNFIISSSPERFLNMDEQGKVKSRPIKGTIARSADKQKDDELKNQLKNSEKDKAENLMITDLMRNDLARSCDDVRVDNLFGISSYATIHHMFSDISGMKQRNAKPIDVVKNCFPPGSMTGTPKIKAMGLCSQLEKQRRCVYSGAIGYFNGNENFDLSVVIRTILVKDNKFEFQVGGAIVADSIPESELNETFIKAKGMLSALGIKESELVCC